MEDMLKATLQLIEKSGWLAPLGFVLLHTLRQFLLVPVLLVCLIGGYLFGTIYGSLYSMIGLVVASVLFYGLVQAFPSMRKKTSGSEGARIQRSGRLDLTANASHALDALCPLSFHFSLCAGNDKRIKGLYEKLPFA